jgi:hypothetical protein
VKLSDAQQTIFGNDVPIIESDKKLIIKHLWSPTPPRWGRRNTLTRSIPGVAKIPSNAKGKARMLAAYFSEVEVVCREMSGQAPHVNVLVKISKKDNIVVDCFPQCKLHYELLKEDCSWRSSITDRLEIT